MKDQQTTVHNDIYFQLEELKTKVEHFESLLVQSDYLLYEPDADTINDVFHSLWNAGVEMDFSLRDMRAAYNRKGK